MELPATRGAHFCIFREFDRNNSDLANSEPPGPTAPRAGLWRGSEPPCNAALTSPKRVSYLLCHYGNSGASGKLKSSAVPGTYCAPCSGIPLSFTHWSIFSHLEEWIIFSERRLLHLRPLSSGPVRSKIAPSEVPGDLSTDNATAYGRLGKLDIELVRSGRI